MAIITKEVLGTTSKSNVTVWAEWNALQPPNRRCYAKAHKSEGGSITFPQPLSGYTKCDLVLSVTLTNSTYKGYSGSGIGLALGGRLFQSTGSTTLQNVTPSTSIPCGTFGNANQDITSLNLPESTKIEELWLTGNAKYVYTFEIGDPTVENLTYQGNFWERDIIVNWRSQNQAGYEYELYYNNNKVKSGTGNKETTFTIPANTFTGTLPASVRVRTYNVDYEGNKYYSEWSEKSISLKDIEATITNLLVSSEYWEKDIELSWQSTDQQQFKIEVWKDNSLLKTYTGTTDKRYTIPSETLAAGTYTFKVWVGYANRFVNFATKNVTLKDIVPTITELNLSGSNIDYDLSLTWQSTDQQKYEVQVLKDTSIVDTRTGAMGKSVLFGYGTLEVGTYTFKVRVGYKDRWSEYKSISTTLVETKPSIGALEPDSVIKKSDEEIRIWWTSTNQSKWKVVVDDALTYTGTLEMEKVVTPNTLSVGKHSILLTVTYVTVKGVEKPVTKKAEFWVQGKPPIPTITSSNVFVTSMPVLTWDTQDQQGYLLEILQDNTLIWTTKWQNGLVTRQKVLAILKDGNYTARLKIINQFSVESDYAIQSFTVSTSEPVEITLKAESMEKFIRLSWDNLEDTFEKFYILRRGKAIACTTETVYDDYTALGSETYTVIGLNRSNVAKYSNSVECTCSIDGCFIAPVDDLSYMFDVGKVAGNYSLKMKATLQQEAITCTGREKPITVFGEHVNTSYTLQFVDYDTYFEFVQLAKRKKILCYRDRHQKLFLSVGNFSYDLDNTMAEYNVPALEVSYSEVIEFD